MSLPRSWMARSMERGIVLKLRDNNIKKINETHRSYDAFQHPLSYVRRDDGYHFGIPRTQRTNLCHSLIFMHIHFHVSDTDWIHQPLPGRLFLQPHCFILVTVFYTWSNNKWIRKNEAAQLMVILAFFFFLRWCLCKSRQRSSQPAKVFLPSYTSSWWDRLGILRGFANSPRSTLHHLQKGHLKIMHSGRPLTETAASHSSANVRSLFAFLLQVCGVSNWLAL